jgi:CheY-like chemotaxis protein
MSQRRTIPGLRRLRNPDYAQLLQCSSLAVLLWRDDAGHRHQLLLRPAVVGIQNNHAIRLCIFVHLKCRRSKDADCRPAKSAPMANTILIVDDNVYIRRAVCNVFQRETDFEVSGEAENGKEAIEKAQELQPDLIVLDLSMPVMNGLDAARVLQRLMPDVPLVMFSEYSDAFSEQEARSIGISALVSKSEHVSVLVNKARSLLYDLAA